jgi:hypothetical protein
MIGVGLDSRLGLPSDEMPHAVGYLTPALIGSWL